jgi:hypothetical protein
LAGFAAICWVPQATSLDVLNGQLLEGYRRRLRDQLRGHEETIGERLVRDLAAFHDLPPVPYDACEKKTGRASSLSPARYICAIVPISACVYALIVTQLMSIIFSTKWC